MAGSIEQGKHAAVTNVERHGSDFYVKIGYKGGIASKGYPFAHGKLDPVATGKLGKGKPKTYRQDKELH